jgi:D-alanyl-lipoteichoic acid acyltransferase DltB (MBOAT superfamily)
MLFNSIEFFVFLAITLSALYALRGHRFWQGGLFAASQIFYGWWDWRFLALFWFSMVSNWWFGERIAAARRTGGRPAIPLAVGVSLNVAILGVFKYADFFLQSLRQGLAGFGFDPGWPLLNILLPLGISFFTFQAIAYLVDIFRDRISPARSLFEFSLFLGFFPQVSAGPIPRAADLIPQLRSPKPITRADAREGGYLILWGLFKKVVVADVLALHVERVYSMPLPDAGSVVVGVLAFTFQIYADFSAYSDIAIGVALLMGIRLQRNFAEPYLAVGPGEFWQRWHITLSQWLRDYLFFPLGGGNRGRLRTHINLMVTFLIGGLWHGAGWTFVLWGLYQGTFIVVGRLLEGLRKKARVMEFGQPAPKEILDGRILRFLRWGMTFLATAVGMGIFRASGLEQLVAFGSGLGGGEFSASFPRQLAVILAFASPLMVHDLLSRWLREPCWPIKRGPVVAVLWILLMVYGIMVLGMASGGQFIYFQF